MLGYQESSHFKLTNKLRNIMRKIIIILSLYIANITAVMAQTSAENITASVAEHDKANIAMMKNDNETAYIHLKKAVELDPTNSTFLNSTAYMAMQAEEYENSIKYLNMALELDKEKFGENHMNVASVINNIASVYSKMGDHVNAISHYQQAYDMVVSSLGEEHPQADIIKRLLDAEKAK